MDWAWEARGPGPLGQGAQGPGPSAPPGPSPSRNFIYFIIFSKDFHVFWTFKAKKNMNSLQRGALLDDRRYSDRNNQAIKPHVLHVLLQDMKALRAIPTF